MWNFPLFPEQASSNAERGGRAVLFELGIVVFFTTLICVLILVVLPSAIAAAAGRPLATRRLTARRWRRSGSVIPLLLSLVMFVWATRRLLRALRAAGRTPSRSRSSASSGCGTCSIPRAVPRSTSCTSRWARPVRLTMTSQDVIHSFFVPAFRIKQDVLPGPLHVALVPAHQGRDATTSSAPSIAARTTR